MDFQAQNLFQAFFFFSKSFHFVNISRLDTGKDAITGTSGKSDLDTGWGSDPISLYWLAITPPEDRHGTWKWWKKKDDVPLPPQYDTFAHFGAVLQGHPCKTSPFSKKKRIHPDPSFDRFHHPTGSWHDPPKNPVRSAKKQRHHLIAFFQACTVWPWCSFVIGWGR